MADASLISPALDNVADAVESVALAGRPSFPGVTIDAAFSRDLDDAIWVEREADGWRITVSIADVCGTVAMNSPEDQAAYAAAFTRYAATRVIHPMLPAALSERRLTLLPSETRDVLGVTLRLSHNLALTDTQIAFGTLAHCGRLSHEQASVLIDGGDPGLHPMIADAWELAAHLLHNRKACGALTYFSIKSGLTTDEEGNLVETGTRGPVSRAYIIVQELMILANRALAEHCARKDIGLLYRNHRASPLADRNALCEDVKSIAEGIGSASTAASTRIGMLLGCATLDAKVTGHFGLNLPAYAWFTSPIRRYADLVNQRIIKTDLLGEASPYSLETLEQIAKRLNETAQIEAEARSAAFKETSERRARRIVADEDFASLDQAGFQAVVKAVFAAEGDAQSVPELLGREVLSRLGAGRLTNKDAVRVLLSFGRVTTPLKADLLHALEGHVAMAQTMLHHMIQAHGLSVPEWSEVSSGPPHAPRFACSANASLDGECYVGAKIFATQRSEAQQRAGLALLAVIARVDWQPPSIWLSGAATSAPSPSSKAVDGNSKGRLQELCQNRRWPMPVYVVVQSGPSHAPSFCGSVHIEAPGNAVMRSSEVIGAGRKEAEHRAAADLIERIGA